jgi:hypothetical protein
MKCHTDSTRRHAEYPEPEYQLIGGTLVTDCSNASHISGSKFAGLFAREAEHVLSQDEFIKLNAFLVFGETRERLASPGNDDLGIILHIQSEEDAIGPFWDPRSIAIRLLEKKGINSGFCFGYDWYCSGEQKNMF